MTLNSGFISLEAFLYLDQMRLVQDNTDVPIIYHYPRHNNNKKLKYPKHAINSDPTITRYSMVIMRIN